MGSENPPPGIEVSQALANFGTDHRLVRPMRFQRPSTLDLKPYSETLWTGLAHSDGQIFFTVQKVQDKWTVKDLTIPLNSYDVVGIHAPRFLTEEKAWQHGSQDFAAEISARGLQPYKLNWLTLTNNAKQGVELIYRHAKSTESQLRLIYRTSDLGLVLYSSSPETSPIRGLTTPGHMPRHIEPVETSSYAEPEPFKLPSFTEICSAGFCLAGLGAVVFLLISSVTQSLKVQSLIEK